MHMYSYNFNHNWDSKTTRVGISDPAAWLLLATVYIQKETGGRQERRKRAHERPLLPKPPRNAQKRHEEKMGEGGPGNCFKTWSLFAIGNRNNQATETNDKRTIPWMWYRKGEKIPAGRPASFSLCKLFLFFLPTRISVQFNKLGSKTNKPHKIWKQLLPSPASEIPCIRQGT